MAGDIRLSRDGAIATVTIDHEARRNAMSQDMWRRLGAVFGEISDDGDLRCVILRGAGETAFCAGADISEFEKVRGTAAASREYENAVRPGLAAVAACPHPVIARIHGPCIGGGLELAACADMRIAGASATFAVPSARLGLVLSFHDLYRVAQLIGPSNLKEVLFEVATMDTAHALRIGLVNRVVPDAEVADNVAATAARIARLAPLTHRWHKQAIDTLSACGHPGDVPDEAHDSAHEVFDSEDFREGCRAFMEKRKPVFKGR